MSYAGRPGDNRDERLFGFRRKRELTHQAYQDNGEAQPEEDMLMKTNHLINNRPIEGLEPDEKDVIEVKKDVIEVKKIAYDEVDEMSNQELEDYMD